MASISIQQGKEAAGAPYAAAGTSIAGQRSALGLNNQATRVEFTGRVAGSETQKPALESAKLQAISAIISRMGSNFPKISRRAWRCATDARINI
jgi:hypothetical protein